MTSILFNNFTELVVRYPFIASELLSCISEEFFDYLDADLQGLNAFWQYLEEDGDLHPTLTVYLAKILMLVLLKRPKTVYLIEGQCKANYLGSFLLLDYQNSEGKTRDSPSLPESPGGYPDSRLFVPFDRN